jgi:hypothetical protein
MRSVNLYRCEVKPNSWSDKCDQYTIAAVNFDKAIERCKRWAKKQKRFATNEIVSVTKFETLGGQVVVEKG